MTRRTLELPSDVVTLLSHLIISTKLETCILSQESGPKSDASCQGYRGHCQCHGTSSLLCKWTDTYKSASHHIALGMRLIERQPRGPRQLVRCRKLKSGP